MLLSCKRTKPARRAVTAAGMSGGIEPYEAAAQFRPQAGASSPARRTFVPFPLTRPGRRLGRGGSARLRRRSLVHDDDWVERYIAVDHYRVLVGGGGFSGPDRPPRS